MANPPPALPQLNPANPPLGYAQHVAQSRANAGPMLHPTQPPWHRPIDPAVGPQHRPAWPNRPAAFTIPLAMPLPGFPDINAPQDHVNAFLETLSHRLGNHDPAAPGYGGFGGAAAPLIVPREVSSSSPANRRQLFQTFRVGNQYFFGTAGGGAATRIQDYSMAVTEAIPLLRMKVGTFLLMAAREQPNQLNTHSSFHNWVRQFPAAQQQGIVNLWTQSTGNHPAEDVWHNVVVLIIRRAGYPEDTADGGVRPGPPYQRVYIYDPAYINENVATHRVTNAHAAGQPSRIRDHLFIRTTQALMTTLSTAHPSRARWIRDAGTVFIGGGSNVAGVDECRRMSCVFLNHAAWLLGRLNRSVDALEQAGHARPSAAYTAFKRAEAEFRDFFHDFHPATVA